MAALLAIRKKGEIDRNRPQTFIVSAAAGSVGCLAGQVMLFMIFKNFISHIFSAYTFILIFWLGKRYVLAISLQ